jgi:hypothetical protein
MKTEKNIKNKIIKYLLFALIIAISTRYIPTCQMNNYEILAIAVIASISFAIIDMISPNIVYNKNIKKLNIVY